MGVLHLTPSSPSWPEELRSIDAPPIELWARGRSELLAQRPRVAIVGSRSPTPYGEAQARRFAEALARYGAVVVSGLARGIDAAAHEGTVAAGGDTIAVLGSGVDRPWPAGDTAELVLARGLLLSEHPPGSAPRRHHFPLRNRLISGLACAVLVIEAAHASGSLITARWAADQGRSVFALPGRVDHPMARGCHRLIREGATLVEAPEGLLEDLGLFSPTGTGEGEEENPHPVVAALTGETLTVDELCVRLRRTAGPLLAELIELELEGIVVRAPGGLYRLVPRATQRL